LGVLYVVSVEAAAGKTAICAGLAGNLLNDGKKVGYLKPQVVEKDGSDSDIVFMKQILGLEDAVNAPDVIKGRDVVLVEASLGPAADDAASKATCGAAKEMKAQAIVVEAYSGEACWASLLTRRRRASSNRLKKTQQRSLALPVSMCWE